MILISKSFSVVSNESAESGDFADSGMEFENEPYSFRELVDLIERNGFTNASCSPATGSTFEWLSNSGDTDYSTGDETTESIHYSRENKPRSAKYWRLAFKAAGIIKQ